MITSIEAILEKNETNFVQVPLSASMISQINDAMDVKFGTMAVHISTGQVHGLLDAVRNSVLEWTLKLEQAGIKGERLSFSREEKQLAKEASTTINIGSIGSMVGNLGTHNTAGDIFASQISATQVQDLTEQLRPHIQNLKSSGADADLLDKSLTELVKQAGSVRPDQNALRSNLTDLRNALSGAAGNLIASGAITIVTKMLGG